MKSADIAEFIEEIRDDPRLVVVFRLLPKDIGAEVFSYLSRDLQRAVVEVINDSELARIIDDLFLDDTVDFLEEMPASIVKRVIKTASSETRKYINQLLMYPEDSAGSLMTIELQELDGDWTVGRSIDEIRRHCADKESISTLFVTDGKRRLEGVISLRDVLGGRDDQLVSELMERNVISVNTHDDQAVAAMLFKKYDFESLPVVDMENRLVGIITIDDIVDVIEEEASEDIYKMAAMQPIEASYVQSGVIMLARKRIVWLVVLMLSATLTGLIIEKYQSALAVNVMLASFIPMLMGTGGNAGSQASVSVIRSLTLGEVGFKDILWIMWKELRISLMVGIMIAAVNYARIIFMYQDSQMALIVSLTLVCVVVVSKLVGCTLPLLATKLRLDPALMASPLITTIVDALSLTIFFNIASFLLNISY
jgi:magnesium transporter